MLHNHFRLSVYVYAQEIAINRSSRVEYFRENAFGRQ